MSTHSTPLGTCPHCRASIPGASLLVEYETDSGRAMYAECPDCEAVVAPA